MPTARGADVRYHLPLGVNDEGVAVILNLVDQVHGMRRVLTEVLRSVRSRA